MSHQLTQPLSTNPQENLVQQDSAPNFGKVAVLLGGNSPEREVSLESGMLIYEALKRLDIDAYLIDPKDGLENFAQHGFDRAFIALHGTDGEDGRIQGFLESLGIPYTGSGVFASALAMDKRNAKIILAAAGLPTAPFGYVENWEAAKEKVAQLGFPLAVKPNAQGSSVGVSCVKSKNELENGFHHAAQYGPVLLEKWIVGKELTVGILGNQVLPPIELKAAEGFYDYHAKYQSELTQYLCPAPLSAQETEEVSELAKKAFHALNCEGWGRVDLMQDKTGQFWILEVNTIPGMTTHSLVPKAAQAVGLNYDNLVFAILKETLQSEDADLKKFSQQAFKVARATG